MQGEKSTMGFVDGNATSPVDIINVKNGVGRNTANIPYDAINGNSSRSLSSIFHSQMPLIEKGKAVVSLSQHHASQLISTLRPWREFFDRTYFARPAGMSEIISRLSRNVRHFYSNYLIVSLICSSYILLINLPFSICLFFGVLFYFYIQSSVIEHRNQADSDQLVYICGYGFTSMQLYIALAVYSLFAFYFTNGSSVVFWLILTSVGVSGTHAVMRRPSIEEPTFSYA